MVRDFALCPDCYDSFLDCGSALRNPPIDFVGARDNCVRELFRQVDAYCDTERARGWRHLAELYPPFTHSYPVNRDAASVVAWLRSISADDFVNFFHGFVCDTFVGWTERCSRVGSSSTWCSCGAQWVQTSCVAPPVEKAAPANPSPSRESFRIAKKSAGWARAAALNRGKSGFYI